MAIYNWSDGERLTAEKLNSWSAEIEGIKDSAMQYRDDAEEFKDSALASKNASAQSEANALDSENKAKTSETNAKASETTASGYVATTNTNKLDSEAWAVGTRGGVPVTSGDPAYHNNAKYYKDQAGQIVGNDYVRSVNDVLPDENGNVDVPADVFIATYGTTTSAEIYDALNSGKIVFARDGQRYAPLTKRYSTTWYEFVCVDYTSANSRYGTPSYSSVTRYEVKSNAWTKDADVGAMPCSQPTSVEYTMLASGWSNSEYSFESEYGVAYNIDIEPSSACTEEQLSAWSEAKMCAVFDSNVVKAMGTVPTIDIPIILTYTVLV